MSTPTEAQQEIIKRMADGDEPSQTFQGWFWLDGPMERVSKRSLDAMWRGGWLVATTNVSYAGFGMRVCISDKSLAWLDSIGYEGYR